MRVGDQGILNKISKIVAPIIGRIIANRGATALIELAVSFLNILIGKGSGTGWDKGEILAAVRFITAQEPVIIDCGANWGNWTNGMRRFIGTQGRWILIEPAVECVRKLQTLSNVEIIEAAVGKTEGRATLFTPGGGAGIASLHNRRDSFLKNVEFEGREVLVTTIDKIIEERNIRKIDFLKIDIEGHELYALYGALKALKKGQISALSFEFGGGNLNSRTIFRDFWELLTPLGYQIYRIYPGGRVVEILDYYEDLEFFRGVSNYIAVKKHSLRVK